MKSICFLFLGLMLLVNACKPFNKDDRDNISFKSNFKAVEDSIKRMNSLMDKTQPIDGGMVNYYFDDKKVLYVNSQPLGKIGHINTDNNGVFKTFSNEEINDLIALTTFLNDNHISSSYKDKPCKCYLYDYRAVIDKSFFMERFIYLEEMEKNYETLFADSKVLDKKGNLTLIGAK